MSARTALVTGANRCLGAAIADRLTNLGIHGGLAMQPGGPPAMRTAGYGRIVNVSSTLASLTLMDRPSEPGYRVSKAALNAPTRVLAAELADSGVLVNAASPGWVRTDMSPTSTRTSTEGADTPVWLATMPDDGPTGGFFRDRRPLEW